MNLLRGGRRLRWPVSIAVGFDSFAQGLTGAIHGEAGILEHLAKSFDGLGRHGAIGHFAVCVEPIVAGNDGSPRIVGSLCSRDDGGKGIQCDLDGGSVPALLIGLINQRLCIGDELVSFGRPVGGRAGWFRFGDWRRPVLKPGLPRRRRRWGGRPVRWQEPGLPGKIS